MGLLSLLAHWWAQEHWGILWAAIIGVVGTLFEAAWEKRRRGFVSKMTWAGIPLVLLFGICDWAAEVVGEPLVSNVLGEILMALIFLYMASGFPPKIFSLAPELGQKMSSNPALLEMQMLNFKKMFKTIAWVFLGHGVFAGIGVGGAFFLADSHLTREFRFVVEYGVWVLLALVFVAQFLWRKK